MYFQNHQICSDNIICTTTTDDVQAPPTRAVVLLLGWYGAKIKQMNKYSKLYQEQLTNCDVIRSIPDHRAILSYHVPSLDGCALETATCVANRIRSIQDNKSCATKRVPLVVHSFSGTGAIILWRLQVLIEHERKKDHHLDTTRNDDLLLVGDHLYGRVFDSSPASAQTKFVIQGVCTGLQGRPLLQLIATIWIGFSSLIVDVLVLLRFIDENPRDAYWNHLLTSTTCARMNEAYIYSANDQITDPTMLEELIAYRRNNILPNHNTDEMKTTTTVNTADIDGCSISRDKTTGSNNDKEGGIISVLKLEDSPHVQHIRKHPIQYTKFIHDFVTASKL